MYAQSITKLAEQIDLPRVFVDIRHECTHDRLPPIETLRSSSIKALQWLKQFYWNPQMMTLAKMPVLITDQLSTYQKEYESILSYSSKLYLNVDCPPKGVTRAASDFFNTFESAGTCLSIQKEILSILDGNFMSKCFKYGLICDNYTCTRDVKCIYIYACVYLTSVVYLFLYFTRIVAGNIAE